jgi:two-component system sensor histidine kinase TctE
MTAYSLRRRLLGWLLLATAVLGLAALVDTWAEARRTAQGVSDRVLAGSAMAIAERVTVGDTGVLEVDIPYSALEMLASTAQDKVFYRVDGPGEAFLTGYADLVPALVVAGEIGFADSRHGAVPIRTATLVRRASAGDGSVPFRVTVAESTRARDALAQAILLRSALRLCGMILGAAAVVWVAVTLALRPLDRLGAVIAARSPDDLRPLDAAVPAEVQGLVAAINSFMRRLDGALAALRNFTGNASHQLRTPMATVRTQLALAAQTELAPPARAAAGKADAALARAERVLAQMLVLARLDAEAGRGAAVPETDVAALARQMTADAVPEAARRGIDLGYEGAESATARAEPTLLGEALQNLIDNALRHAGRGAEVTVRVSAAGPVVLEVEDNGPGLSPARRAAVAAGRRGQTDSPEGQGFGLAIVHEIAARLGAGVDLAEGRGGRGLCVRLSLGAAA